MLHCRVALDDNVFARCFEVEDLVGLRTELEDESCMIKLAARIRANYLSTVRVRFEKQDVERVGRPDELLLRNLLLLPKFYRVWSYRPLLVPFRVLDMKLDGQHPAASFVLTLAPEPEFAAIAVNCDLKLTLIFCLFDKALVQIKI